MKIKIIYDRRKKFLLGDSRDFILLDFNKKTQPLVIIQMFDLYIYLFSFIVL